MLSSTSPNTNIKQTKKCFNHDQSEFITTTQDIRDGLREVGHQPEETSSPFKNKIQPKGPLLKGIVS